MIKLSDKSCGEVKLSLSESIFNVELAILCVAKHDNTYRFTIIAHAILSGDSDDETIMQVAINCVIQHNNFAMLNPESMSVANEILSIAIHQTPILYELNLGNEVYNNTEGTLEIIR